MVKFPNLSEFKGIDLSSFDVSKLTESNQKLVAAVRDAAYVTVGFGVLAFQQAQVKRRELVNTIATKFGDASKTQIEELLSSMESQLAKLDGRIVAVEGKIDGAVEKFEQRLPEPAAAIVNQAHGFAKAARSQVRSLVRPAA